MDKCYRCSLIKNEQKNRSSLIIKGLCLLLLLTVWILSGRNQVRAAAEENDSAKSTTTAAKKKTGWKKKDGYYYYYNENKKKAAGYVTIGDKKYLFDSKGRQKTGWRKVGKNVRYFQIQNGPGGYLVTGKNVNGVKLDEKGVAKSSAGVKEKISLLLRFQKLADRLVRPGTPRKTKLYKVFMYARSRSFRETGNAPHTKHWDQWHARCFLELGSVDCVMAACGFGYLANAIGYKNITVKLYGHGHCEINKLCYDPSIAKTLPPSQYTQYYGRKYSEVPRLWTGPKVDTRKI